jgi:branched-chain amino acid transport system permease protein
LFAALALATAVVVIIGPALFDRFTLNVLTRSMIYAMLAVTVDILWGYTGILTFGQAAFFGTGAYASAMVLSHLGSTPAFLVLALALAIVVPVLLGGFVGWLSFGHGSTPLYATVISLVVPIVVTQLVFSGGVWTGSSSGLVGYSGLPLGLPGYFRLIGICLVLTTFVALVFTRSDAGKLLVAIRDNEARCAYLGLDPQRLKIVLTTILAGVAGIAGFLYANASGVVAPENTGFVFGTEIVIWTALGGRGTIIGPVMGAIGIDYLSAQLSGDLPFLWNLVVGTLFVVMIILLPNGLAQMARIVLPRRNAAETNTAGSPAIAVAPADNGSAGGNNVLSVSGAGKTTLMRCLSDGTEATTGSVSIAGRNINGMTPDEIVALGVGRKFQVASVFDSLTVADCLRMARASRQSPSLLRRSATLGLPAAAADILRSTGLDQMLGRPVSLLSHGQKQSLELAMVVALEPKLILLDEPTAGLTKVERTTIGATLQKLTGELGFAAILVEHDLDFVRDISTRIVVLHQGKLVLDGSVAEVVNSETVKTIYSGAAHG